MDEDTEQYKTDDGSSNIVSSTATPALSQVEYLLVLAACNFALIIVFPSCFLIIYQNRSVNYLKPSSSLEDILQSTKTILFVPM